MTPEQWLTVIAGGIIGGVLGTWVSVWVKGWWYSYRNYIGRRRTHEHGGIPLKSKITKQGN